MQGIDFWANGWNDRVQLCETALIPHNGEFCKILMKLNKFFQRQKLIMTPVRRQNFLQYEGGSNKIL